jgi:transcriptional regulator with XRE-family HTH domain
MPEPRSSQPLGVRLNRMRREAGLTLADVANALGVSKPTVWAWEKGKARPLPERLDAIAAVLGVAAEELTESHGVGGAAASVIEDCRQRIAAACGTQPGSVRILIEL